MNFILFILTYTIQICISTYTIIFLSKLFRKENFLIKDYIVVFIFSSISIILCSLLKSIIPPLNTILALIFIFLIFTVFFKFTIAKSFILLIFDFICTILSEIGAYALTTLLLNRQFDSLITNSYYLLIILILQFILIIIFTNIIKIFLNKCTKLSTLLKNISNKQLFIFIILLVICICPQLTIFIINKYAYSIQFTIINCIQLLIIGLFIFVYINKSLEKNKAESELVTTKIHNETMSGVIDGLKTLKHDFNNIIQTLNAYSKSKEYHDLDIYIDKLLKEFKIVNTLGSIDPEIFNEPGIYGIVGAKYFLITEQSIPMDIDIFTNIKEINFPMPELSRILGILLDNAFEATKKCTNPYVKLEMKFDKRKCADIIRVINTYDTTVNIDLEKIYKKGYSSKEVKSGIGLWETKKIVSKLPHSQIFPTVEDDKFIQTIVIEKNLS